MTDLTKTIDDLRHEISAGKQRLQDLNEERRGLILDAQMGDAAARKRIDAIADEKAETTARVEDLRTALADAKQRLATAERQRQAEARKAQRKKIADTIEAARPKVDAYADAVLRVQTIADDLASAMQDQEVTAAALTVATGFGAGRLTAHHARLRARTYLLQRLGLKDETHHSELAPLMRSEEHIVGDHLAHVERAISDNLDAFDDLDPQLSEHVAATPRNEPKAQRDQDTPSTFFGKSPAGGRVVSVAGPGRRSANA